jgi:hypothetical protein
MKKWLAKKKYDLAIKWIGNSGLTVCRIVGVAGTDYIVAKDGSMRKIGKRSIATVQGV